jgi:hypothetical protein
MTRLAIDSGMRPEQRKPVQVLLHGFDGDLPASDCVAVFAAGAKLAPVNVRMTVCASRAHVPEQRTGMAAHAGHFSMHPAQWIAGFLIVVKIGLWTNGPPARSGVASLAGKLEGTMWIARPARLRRGLPKERKR